MTIQSIGSGTNNTVSSMAQSFIQKIDGNNDGSINKSEFQSFLNKSSTNSISKQDSVNLFNGIDANKDSSISQTELESFLKKMSAARGSSDPSKTQSSQESAAPGGGAGNAKGVGGASSTSGSSTSLAYDVRDTNQDGVVSPQEELAYEAQHPNNAVNNQKSTSNTSQYQNAISQYQQNGIGSSTQSQLSLTG